MNLRHIAAFSDGDVGGNPAGVWIGDALPPDSVMQRTAKQVGFSETVFAEPMKHSWRVRYFSPETEVPFCGHATIALGAALALDHGDGTYALALNDAHITVEGHRDGDGLVAAFQSPQTHSKAADPALVNDALALFGYSPDDLDPRIPPAIACAGAAHLVLAFASRAKLAAMTYNLEQGRTLMNRENLVTIALVHAQTPLLFHARNAFASGGVYEDPATGAAAAAFAGYLRDIGWQQRGVIDIVQGEDMGSRSRLRAEYSRVKGSSIRVSGTARVMKRC
jgi:PhzF family phenazine biosynthesis protein